MRRLAEIVHGDVERMYRQHRDRLFAFLVYRTGNRALAEDLLGDVFERAFRARARFDPRRGSEMTWLYTIAINRLHDHHRRAQVERAAMERIKTAAPVALEPADVVVAERDRVMQALGELSDRDREVIALRFGADLTAAQIARVISQPLTTVEGRLFRALGRLRKMMMEPVNGVAADMDIVVHDERVARRASS